MKVFYQTLPLLFAFVLFACGGSNESSDNSLEGLYDDEEETVDDTPIEASFDEILNGEIDEYRTVIFESFVAPLPSTMYFGDGELSLDFYPRRNQTGGPHMRVDIAEGSSENHVSPLPEEYYQEDLKIHTNNGDVAVVGDYVRITGVYSEASDDNYQYIDLVSVEKLDYAFDESVFTEAAELTDEFMTNEANDDGYAYVDGTLDLMMFMSSYDGQTYSVKIDQDMNSYSESVYINIGTGPSTMNELHEGFGDSDFIVRDFKGDEYKGKSAKFRLYGTFNQLDVESKGMFNVEEIKVIE